MYEMPWVQQLIHQTQHHLIENSLWLNLTPSKPQRIVDYACGHGTVSSALLPLFPLTTFHGLDIATSQVERFNIEARKLVGEENGKARMIAIQGDLTSPSSELMEAEWFNFDIAIISMALHHVMDPISLLTRLRERVRRGGTIIVVDWVKAGDNEVDGEEGERYEEKNMRKLEHGPKIWPGFSRLEIEADLRAAGCEGVEIKLYPVEIEAPEFMWGYDKMFIAKGIVV
jgi:SAM-dependent methyltransferase